MCNQNVFEEHKNLFASKVHEAVC